MSKLEDLLLTQIKAMGIPHPEQEYRFAAHHVGMGRGIRERLLRAGLKDCRFDFCWPDLMLAVEVEGGIFVNGRHTRGKGFENDMEKYHHAQRLGFTVYRCGSRLIKSGESVQLIKAMIDALSDNE